MGLEERVTAKLRELDDTTLDRVARAYARSRFPDRFSWIDGLGVNDEGQPIGGRPDAFVRAPDGNLDRIETTRHAKKSEIRNKTLTGGHFPSILTNICQSGDGGGLVYVAGHPKIQFTPQDIADMTNAAVAAGLDRERVHIVGGDALADALCRPELAGTRIRLLGVGDPKQFALVRRELSPDQRRPTAEDLNADQVHFPKLGTEVERQLREQRICLVRGLGASGKSVLAWLVGLRWGEFGDPAYLVNLQTIADDVQSATRQCVEDLKLLGAANALFILDNCHLEDEAARKIYLAWEEIRGVRPALLLLARETRDRSGSRIDGLDLEPLVLRAKQVEVLGVFQRLAARHLRQHKNLLTPPTPPKEVLDTWVSTFGGDPALDETTTDLIAFSAAVQRRINQLLDGHWTLTEGDAADEILVHYIRPLSIAERQNLYRLSVFQEIEFALPDHLLFDIVEGLSTCVDKLGIVFIRERGPSKMYRYYQLAHPALGPLILQASGESINRTDIYRVAAATSGFDALMLLYRLRAAGRDLDTEAVRIIMLANPQILARLGPTYSKRFLIAVCQSSHHAAFASFTTELATPDRLNELVTSAISQPNNIGDFLRYMEQSKVPAFRAIHKTLAAKLAHSTKLSALAVSLAHSRLHFLTDFLRYLEQSKVSEFSTLHPALATKLTDKSNLSALVETAISSPLPFLADFLRYLEQSEVLELMVLHQTLAVKLADGGQLPALASAAARSPLGELAAFLRYLEWSKVLGFKTLHQSLATKLADESQLPSLAKTAARSPLGDLASFLHYLEQSTSANVRALFPRIVQQLGMPDVSASLATTALNAPIDHLEGFLNLAGGRELFDPLMSTLADHCSEKDAHAEILARRAEAMVMEADLSFGYEGNQRCISRVQRVEALFGTSTARSIQDVVKDASFMRASFHAALGDLDLAMDALDDCRVRGMANLRMCIERESRFHPIRSTPALSAFLASPDLA
jgi:hypothetical protein